MQHIQRFIQIVELGTNFFFNEYQATHEYIHICIAHYQKIISSFSKMKKNRNLIEFDESTKPSRYL